MKAKKLRRSLMMIVMAFVVMSGGMITVPKKVSAATDVSGKYTNGTAFGPVVGKSSDTDIKNAISTRNKGITIKAGYCTNYTRDKLVKMGYPQKTFKGDGIVYYSKFKNGENVPSGYVADCVDGNNALNTLVSRYKGKALYNIVVSFGKGTYKYNTNKAAGHVLLIDCIKDGKVYFSEMFDWSDKMKAGSIQVWTIANFNKKYLGVYECIKGAALVIKKGNNDTTAPQITNAKITNLDSKSVTIECDITDNVKVSKAQISVWKDGEKGADTAKWYNPVSVNGNHYVFKWSVADFGNYIGKYKTNIHAWDSSNNKKMYDHANDSKFIYTPVVKTTNNTMKLSGNTKITSIDQGKAWTCDGIVSSDYNLKYVNGYIITNTGKSDKWNEEKKVFEVYNSNIGSKSYNLKNSVIDKGLLFNKLSPGNYYYIITARDEKNNPLQVVQTFTVRAVHVHNYNIAGNITKAATCTEKGIQVFRCSCGDSVTKYISELGHDWEYHAAKKATCTSYGLSAYSKCKRCGCYNTAVRDIEPTGHKYDNGVITKAATCTEDGVITFTCTVCGDTKTEIVSKTGHTIVADNAVAPTYTGTGLTEGSHCSVCHQVIVKQETVPMLVKEEKPVDIISADDSAKVDDKISQTDNANREDNESNLNSDTGSEDVKDIDIHSDVEEDDKDTDTNNDVEEDDENVFEIGDVLYEITGKKEVKYLFNDADTIKVAVIPDTVKYNNITYAVTSIADEAFNDCTSLKKLTIGKNITKIGKNAFNGCKNLKTITIKSTKLTKKSFGKNAFKGINKKATIKVSKKQLKNYKKWIKQAGAPKTVKVKK